MKTLQPWSTRLATKTKKKRNKWYLRFGAIIVRCLEQSLPDKGGKVKGKCNGTHWPGNKTAAGRASWQQASWCPSVTGGIQTAQPETHWEKDKTKQKQPLIPTSGGVIRPRVPGSKDKRVICFLYWSNMSHLFTQADFSSLNLGCRT